MLTGPTPMWDMFKSMLIGKYFWLAVSLLIMVLVGPVFSEHQYGIRFADLFNSLVLLTAIYAIVRSRRHVIIGFLLMVPGATCHGLYYFVESPVLVLLGHLFISLFVLYLIFIILADVLSERHVTTDTLIGTYCVFLLIGLLFAMGYSLAIYMDPTCLKLTSDRIDPDSLVFFGVNFGHTVYFSFVTLTTLGYGDMSPTTDVTRSLAAIQAVTGQIYIAILVARLVGMHIQTSSTPAE